MFEEYIQNDILRALTIVFLIFVIFKLLIFIIEKTIVRLVKKTKTDIDDKIIEKSSNPISIIIFLVALKIALGEISFSEDVIKNFIKIIYSIISVVLGYLIYTILNLIISGTLKKASSRTKINVNKGMTSLIHGVLKIIWIIVIGLYILRLWGIEIGPFLAGLGIGGIAIAFAMQESLSNIFGGISIILDKTVKVGDLIYLDDKTKGAILHIGLRSTKIKTFDNEMIIIPNSKLASGKIQNVAQPEPKSRVVIPFSVGYGSNVEEVKKIVLRQIKKIKNIEKNPLPSVKFLEMADSSLNFKAYFYINSFEYRLDAVDEANTRIYNALNESNIEIPFPKMDINIKK